MKIRFSQINHAQLERLSEFCSNLSLVFFASLVVPVFTGNVDKMTFIGVVFGVGLTLLAF